MTVSVSLIDSRLVGTWVVGSYKVTISPNGEYDVVGAPIAFSLSVSGQTLTISTNPPEAFTRTSGAAESIIGGWTRSYVAGGSNRIETIDFRSDGTYSMQTTYDGIPDTEVLGRYHIDAALLFRTERYSTLQTIPPDTLILTTIGSPTYTGTFAVDPSGDSWTHTWEGGYVEVYTRA